jgi:hypothetical protein
MVEVAPMASSTSLVPAKTWGYLIWPTFNIFFLLVKLPHTSAMPRLLKSRPLWPGDNVPY